MFRKYDENNLFIQQRWMMVCSERLWFGQNFILQELIQPILNHYFLITFFYLFVK